MPVDTECEFPDSNRANDDLVWIASKTSLKFHPEMVEIDFIFCKFFYLEIML